MQRLERDLFGPNLLKLPFEPASLPPTKVSQSRLSTIALKHGPFPALQVAAKVPLRPRTTYSIPL